MDFMTKQYVSTSYWFQVKDFFIFWITPVAWAKASMVMVPGLPYVWHIDKKKSD